MFVQALISYVHQHDSLGYLIAFVDLVPVATEKVRQSYPVENFLESVEEYSEGKIHKSEPEPGNGNVNTLYFVNQDRGNTWISRMEFVYDEVMNEHTIANVCLYLSFLFRIMFVTNILLQISF